MMRSYPKKVQQIIRKSKQEGCVKDRLSIMKPSPHPPNVKRVHRKMTELAQYQCKVVDLLFTKVNTRSKAIKKKERFLNNSLKSKAIDIDDSKFNILALIKNNITANKSDSENEEPSKKDADSAAEHSAEPQSEGSADKYRNEHSNSSKSSEISLQSKAETLDSAHTKVST